MFYSTWRIQAKPQRARFNSRVIWALISAFDTQNADFASYADDRRIMLTGV